jgi:hypothetical protein
MSRWEYLIMNIPADPVAATRRLNELGAEGWELVHVSSPATVKNALVHLCWFRRVATGAV